MRFKSSFIRVTRMLFFAFSCVWSDVDAQRMSHGASRGRRRHVTSFQLEVDRVPADHQCNGGSMQNPSTVHRLSIIRPFDTTFMVHLHAFNTTIHWRSTRPSRHSPQRCFHTSLLRTQPSTGASTRPSRVTNLRRVNWSFNGMATRPSNQPGQSGKRQQHPMAQQ
jgi:hypothetical protein